MSELSLCRCGCGERCTVSRRVFFSEVCQAGYRSKRQREKEKAKPKKPKPPPPKPTQNQKFQVALSKPKEQVSFEVWEKPKPVDVTLHADKLTVIRSLLPQSRWD